MLRRLGAGDPDVLVGPSYGEDAAIVAFGGGLLALHSDPITAAGRLAGWLSVHVASNDVAVSGARPRWASVVVLLPEGAGRGELEEVVSQVDEAAREVGVSVVGGHTEVAPGLRSPIVVSTVVGEVVRATPTAAARPGDVVVMTKTAAVEGTAVLATDYRERLEAAGVPAGVLERAAAYYRRVSVVREALALARRGLARAMHDPTEGGILGGVSELAHASRVRVVVYEERIPVAPETAAVTRPLGVDPLRLLASGSLIASVPRALQDEALEALSLLGVEATVIGEVEEGEPGAVLVRRDGSREELPRQVPDEIYRLAGSP